MEIKGTILSKHVDQIRLVTASRAQEIDVFYKESLKFDVEELTVGERVVIEVEIQSIDYFSLKLGKFWLTEIISPKKKFVYKKKVKGESGGNWSENRLNKN